MIHHHEIKVRGFHTDMFGHVNNARYLEFLEEARWELLEQHMDYNKWARQGFAFIVVNINISYRNPAKFGDVVEIQSSIANLGGKSGTVHQEIYLKGTEIKAAEADVTFVIIDIKTNKAIKIEGEMYQVLNNLVEK
jgi:thioesterase III